MPVDSVPAGPDTPFLAVDAARMQHNLDRVAGVARAAGLELRPHAKTHKCLEVARRQIAAGATGLTVATIGEAEVFAAHAAATGCRDLFIAYPLWVTGTKGRRLAALADQVRVRVGVDSVEGARQLAGELGTRSVEVVIEVDSGQHRTGVAPERSGEVASAARDLGLDVVGVFTFPGHGYGIGDTRRDAAHDEARVLSVAAQRLSDEGIEPRVRSGGSTPTLDFADGGVLTEIRPGVYPFNDAQQLEMCSCGIHDASLWAVTTVVHRTGHRVVVDAGSKILGADRPSWTTGFGRLPDHLDARVTSLSEHHAVVEFPDGAASEGIPAIGSRIRLIPNHVCTAVNLVDELMIVDDRGDVTERWDVVARGENS
ncbi:MULTISPECIES: alanine racemase [unclassified Gordonia (in: high G+C Gram-positive bacteria)]|uniref:alanine racemase n=1 Tax=unclassified Gordonia (in: high G+C Gram-positive bacteria) TaxID=2657482 RepID=UPI001F0F4BED|nr:alanine racemase [Gordonia sp. ABSL49_1]MCH5643209.1 alanine racemase [Gordonia sp. ABSL49_1]